MYRCHYCKLVFLDDSDVPDTYDGDCPVCGTRLNKCCPNDVANCNHSVVSGTKVCDICDEFVCPECGSHDVDALSRTTGYYAPLKSWNVGKMQEFNDRTRYTV